MVFFGTPDLAVPYLHAMQHAGHNVCMVVTQPDRPAGRGQQLRPSPVKRAGEEAGLPVLQPASCRDRGFLQALHEARAECGVVVAYGQILPPEVLACPEHGCLNVHYSLLPSLRGAAPVQWALMLGLKETGVTVQLMSAELDAGDIIIAERVPIDEEDNAESLLKKLNGVGPSLLLQALDMVDKGQVKLTPQDETQVTWAPPLTAEHCHIDWSKPAEDIRNLVRACAPRPGAFTFRGNRRIKVLRAAVVSDTSMGQRGQPGTLAEKTHDGHPVVWAGRDALALLEVQAEGKQRMSGEAFARGARFEPGERLS